MIDFRCNRCDWTPNPTLEDKPKTQLALHAIDSYHPLCACCPRSLSTFEERVCETCITTARTLLSGILLMYDELPHHLAHLSSGLGGSSAHTDSPLPGGQALVLLGAGSEGLDEDGTTTHQDDLSSVSYELGWWAEQWQAQRDELKPLGSRPATIVHNAAAYLDTHARWAANEHPGFCELLTDLTRIHSALEHATGRSRKAARANASCFDCKGQLVRRIDPRTGLEDQHVTCDRCHRRYTPVDYALALKAAAESASRIIIDDQLHVTLTVAARHLGRAVQTLRNWTSAGLLTKVHRGGLMLINLEAAEALSEARGRRARRSA